MLHSASLKASDEWAHFRRATQKEVKRFQAVCDYQTKERMILISVTTLEIVESVVVVAQLCVYSGVGDGLATAPGNGTSPPRMASGDSIRAKRESAANFRMIGTPVNISG